MHVDVTRGLCETSTLVLSAALGCGHLLGYLRVRGAPLGSSTGVLLTGLLVGHLGFGRP